MNRRGTICTLKCDSSGFNGFVDWGFFFQAISMQLIPFSMDRKTRGTHLIYSGSDKGESKITPPS